MKPIDQIIKKHNLIPKPKEKPKAPEKCKPIIEEDSKGNVVHYKDSDGYEWWSEYNKRGKEFHHKDNDGFKRWSEYDKRGNATRTLTKFSNGTWLLDGEEMVNKNKPAEGDRRTAPCDKVYFKQSREANGIGEVAEKKPHEHCSQLSPSAGTTNQKETGG